MKSLILFTLLLTAGIVPLFGQVFSTPAPLVLVGEMEPAPYEPEEFPPWAWGIRRFEVILFGSFPLMYMMSALVYDFTIYAMNEFDQEYQMGTARSQNDFFNMAMIALSLSGAIAIADLIIQTIKTYREDHAAQVYHDLPPPGGDDPD